MVAPGHKWSIPALVVISLPVSYELLKKILDTSGAMSNIMRFTVRSTDGLLAIKDGLAIDDGAATPANKAVRAGRD